jgi:hypothetical protein
MTKNFCDICSKEIESIELVGMYTRVTKQFTVDMQPQMGRQECLLCSKCQEEVSTKIEKMRNENNQPAHLDKISSLMVNRQSNQKREGDVVGI